MSKGSKNIYPHPSPKGKTMKRFPMQSKKGDSHAQVHQKSVQHHQGSSAPANADSTGTTQQG